MLHFFTSGLEFIAYNCMFCVCAIGLTRPAAGFRLHAVQPRAAGELGMVRDNTSQFQFYHRLFFSLSHYATTTTTTIVITPSAGSRATTTLAGSSCCCFCCCCCFYCCCCFCGDWFRRQTSDLHLQQCKCGFNLQMRF
jgi:hypothetical protein